jgi:hypothetical protein
MTDYRFTLEAEDDVFEIWSYIARDSVAAPIAWNPLFTMLASF